MPYLLALPYAALIGAFIWQAYRDIAALERHEQLTAALRREEERG